MKNNKNALAKLSAKPKNKKVLVQQNWAKLEKWISVKGLKVVLILEGDDLKGINQTFDPKGKYISLMKAETKT